MILLFDTNIESIFHIRKIYNKKNTIFNFNIKFMELENNKLVSEILENTEDNTGLLNKIK